MREQEQQWTARNEVVLLGRVAAAPQERALPSGDVLVSWRLVVDRDAAAGTGTRRPTVDTVDCVAFAARVRRTAGTWVAGDVVELEGALRRRFWRAPTGPTSRYEVEVRAARRVLRAA